ncbi:ATP-binding protein [Geobacter sp. OR-1]|uniref:ATP-binding protein n=1 Tax=Geobacter sp. OR-1 TaxID=1266765 RepID=UPI000A7BA12F|nr:ATP-binding protein [Geobacter sp. OR-1]
MTYIQRDIENRLERLLASSPCVAVTGPRQAGKSTLLRHCLPDYRYRSLDDPFYREQALADPHLFLDDLGERAIIDEIQLAPGLLSYVKLRVDERRDVKGRFVFTGSQQFGLIKNLSDSLAGRIALLELLPFSIAEKRRFLALPNAIDLFTDAALNGCYPELVVDQSVDRQAWYASYLQTYLERDIRTIYNIGDLRDFQRFVRLLAARCGQQLNMSDFSRDLGISVPTIKSWLLILEASRVVYLLPPYFTNLGKRITKAPKIYFLDIGLACHLAGVRDETHLFNGPMAGHLFENFCVQETVKFFLGRGEQPPLYYIRTGSGLEVDLLIEPSAGMLIPVEIKLTKTPSPNMARTLTTFRDSFASLVPAAGLLLSLADQPRPLTRDVAAVTLDDYFAHLQQVAG